MDNTDRIAKAKKRNRQVKFRAALRLLGFCTLTGLLSAFIGFLIRSCFTEKGSTGLSLLICFLFSPVWFLIYYYLYLRIDDAILSVRAASDELATIRCAAVAEPNAFIMELREKAVVPSRKTLLTPDMIMTYGVFQTCLPLNRIQAISIEPHPENRAYLLVHAYAGEEHLRYTFECPECFGTDFFLRETAARITECFRVNAPQCQISSPYLEQLPPHDIMRKPF